MDPQIYLAFVIATAIMIALPGPSVMLLIAHSISYGWKPALATVAGETAGIAVQLTIAAAGLASLLSLVTHAFEWLRWAGALYLVYLGIRQWQGAGRPPSLNTPQVSGKNLFVQGLVVTIPNPKSLIFIAAFLPQFIDPARPAGLQFAMIVPTFLVITFAVASIWAVAAGNARRFLGRQRTFKTLLRAAGGFMILAGVGLALARKTS